MSKNLNRRQLFKKSLITSAGVAAADGTDSLDAAKIYDKLRSSPYNFMGNGLYDKNNSKSLGTGIKCRDLGSSSDSLNVSGHGVTTQAQIYSESGYGLYTDKFTPSDISTYWSNGELEWCLFAACSQVRIEDYYPGTTNTPVPTNSDNAIKWIKAMPNVHVLLGYSYNAPSSGTDVIIADAFCGYGQTYSIPMAWMLANRPSATVCRGRYAKCLVREGYTGDKLKVHKADNPRNTYRLYYLRNDGDASNPNWNICSTPTFTLP